LTQTARNVELETLVKSQADKIAEFEKMCASLRWEKEDVTAGYRRLSVKHKALAEKTYQERAQLAETQAELRKLYDDLDLETCSYTEYHQNVRGRHCDLHQALASSFDEVKAQCMPFPNKGVVVEEMIDLIAEEVKAVPDTVWRLNDNFAVLGIEGVLNMLHGEGCQELGRLRDLAVSRDAMVLKDVPEDVRKLAG
jgi:uncharacterized protein YhaN